MFEIGRICVKLAGRDAGMKCVVIDHVDKHTVMIDGESRRKKCNVKHLEPTDQIVKLSKGAAHAEVERAMKEMGHSYTAKKADKKDKKAAPRRSRVTKAKPVKPVKAEVKPKKAKKEE